ncbi:MAG: hypothetical protein RSB04_07355 [Gordonibacter sp.]|uniref:hypothetical protein n=1 Tax=Gordonibacter sp. TaxID=1968902 RepID=UPI002FC5E7B7
MVIECVDPSRVDDLKATLEEFANLMERYLGATIEVNAVVDRENPELVIIG